MLFFNKKLMIEEWREIDNYPNYQISNWGNVKSKRGLLKPSIKNGYYFVLLSKNGKTKNFYIHRLVATYFLNNEHNKKEIDHINTIRTDNRVENLRWVTKSENMKNPLTIEKCSKKMMGKTLKSKPILQFSKQGDFIREWNSAMEIKRELGLNNFCINKCCRGLQYTSGGYKWLYKSA